MENNNFLGKVVAIFKNMEGGKTAVSPDNTILIQQLHKSEILTVYLLAGSDMPPAQRGKSIIDLRDQIDDLFDGEELRTVCFELGEELENMAGQTKSAKCLSLADMMRRHGRLPDLLDLLKKHRPNAVWPDAKQITLPTIVKKDNLAVVVGMIHRRDGSNVLQDVANYLNEQGKDANILLFITSGIIPLEADWQQFPQVFRDVIDDTLSQTGTKVGHFFLAGTGAMLFSMGCIWSTVGDSTLYHWQGGTYHPIITLPL
ncbi:MAG: SAVED domain-containing protein [Ardenticatenaceae bacterium]|nr:SAVED domain-containing protein [Ardenticatenaceae bacterium]